MPQVVLKPSIIFNGWDYHCEYTSHLLIWKDNLSLTHINTKKKMKLFFFACLARNEMQFVRCYPMLCSDNSCGTHFPVFGIFSKLVNIFQLLNYHHQVFQPNQKLIKQWWWWVIIQELASYLAIYCCFVLSPKSNLGFNFANDSQPNHLHQSLLLLPSCSIVCISSPPPSFCSLKHNINEKIEH